MLWKTVATGESLPMYSFVVGPKPRLSCGGEARLIGMSAFGGKADINTRGYNA